MAKKLERQEENESELPKNERDFYVTLAQELIKSSISRAETNASNTLTIVTIFGTLYGAIVGFFIVSGQYFPTLHGGLFLSIPEVLLIIAAFFIAKTIVPINLTNVSISAPELTYSSYSSMVNAKTKNMKWSFAFLILALIMILVVMLAMVGWRDILLQKIVSS